MIFPYFSIINLRLYPSQTLRHLFIIWSSVFILRQVETVGDVYVLVSGLPIRNGDRHIVEVVNCSLDLISAILNFKVPHKPSAKLPLRIGTPSI